jgi:hypothetical protein
VPPTHELAMALDPALLARRLGINLDEWQQQFIRSRAKRILLNVTRQGGKSTAAATLALHTVLYEPHSLVLLLSPSLRQSSELFRKVLDGYRTLDRPVDAEIENRLSLELESGNRVVSLPGAEATIRGMSGVTLLIIDEASRVSDELLAAVRPMLAVSGGRLIALSTPNGPLGWWAHAWLKESHWEKYEVPASKCPRITQEFLDEERAALGMAAYSREYECSFEVSEGALWKPTWLDENRVTVCPMLSRIAVALDPSASSEGDECGIVVGGVDDRYPAHAYILDDVSVQGSPDTWMRTAITAYYSRRCDRMIAERNNGGEMVETILRQIDPNVSYDSVWASHGKRTRAEPVSALAEQGRIHHVGTFAKLEKELVTWDGSGRSPNRLDALCWLIHFLVLTNQAPLSGYVLEKDRHAASSVTPTAMEALRARKEELARELAALDARFGRNGR